MLRLEGNQEVEFCDGLSRRDFLRVGGLSMGLTLTELARLSAHPEASREPSCIQLFLVGGPSHLETFDPKPEAPEGIRGPFRPIRTAVPGLFFSEHLPRLARLADRFAVLRSIHHREAPIHETGHQLMQTGFLYERGKERPHMGAVVSRLLGPRNGMAPWALVPAPIGNTGVVVDHGQTPGFLGPEHGPLCPLGSSADWVVRSEATRHGLDPARLSHRSALLDALAGVERSLEDQAEPTTGVSPHLASLLTGPARSALDLHQEPASVRERYGSNTFGQSCLLARRLVEHGVRLATVNMFDTVFNRITWDCHANGGDLGSTLDDYRKTLCPMLDQAVSTLLVDLEERGLLKNTVVLCMGEFGRTPRINNRGGRDHWPGVWSGLMAGGPIRGGQVVGSSDHEGREPKERPIHPAEIVATVYHCLGLDPGQSVQGGDGQLHRLVEAEPITELF